MNNFDEKNDSQDERPLSNQTGFWRRVDSRGTLKQSDIFRIRDDLKRIDSLVEKAAGGCDSQEVMKEIGVLRDRVEKDYGTQALIVQTLIEILIDKGIMTEDEFIDKLDEIDMRDGVQDGTLGSQK